MCGEIEDWQEGHNVTVRLSANGLNGKTQISLNSILPQCEELRLDEVLLVGFNGGVAGTFYLNVEINGMTSNFTANENRSGLLLAYDPLHAHQIFSRPKTISRGMTTLQTFGLSILQPNGNVPAFTEVALMFTAVCRKTASQIADIRRMRQQMQLDRPNIRDGVVANSFAN